MCGNSPWYGRLFGSQDFSRALQDVEGAFKRGWSGRGLALLRSIKLGWLGRLFQCRVKKHSAFAGCAGTRTEDRALQFLNPLQPFDDASSRQLSRRLAAIA